MHSWHLWHIAMMNSVFLGPLPVSDLPVSAASVMAGTSCLLSMPHQTLCWKWRRRCLVHDTSEMDGRMHAAGHDKEGRRLYRRFCCYDALYHAVDRLFLLLSYLP